MEKYPHEDEIKDFLLCLPKDDVFALANTISQGLLKHKIQDTEGAIKTILKYSPDTASILRRKAITRDILFTYLDDKNVTLTLPTTKDALIDKVITFWDKNKSKEDKTIEAKSENAPIIQNVYNIYVHPQQSAENTTNETDKLAVKFSEWFYSIMNSKEAIGSEHFYPDAKLKLNLISSGITESQSVQDSPEQIAQLLFTTKCEHNLYFNPNLTDQGVKGQMNCHGLVMVAICGSIHIDNQCVGVFEQVFGLAKDPAAENNWKIKYTELNLRNQSGVTAMPNLGNTDLESLDNTASESPEMLEITEA